MVNWYYDLIDNGVVKYRKKELFPGAKNRWGDSA